MKLTYRKTYERCARSSCWTTRERRIFRNAIRRAIRNIERAYPWDQRAAEFEAHKGRLLHAFGIVPR
jgi:hypothetical protein